MNQQTWLYRWKEKWITGERRWDISGSQWRLFLSMAIVMVLTFVFVQFFVQIGVFCTR